MMGLLNKLFTAVRGGAREAGEAIVDANAIRIYEQEIVDAENHLAKAKNNLTEVMAKRMQVNRKLDALKQDIAENESYAEQALSKGNEALALEVAEKIARIETEASELQEAYDSYTQHIEKLKEQIASAERQVSENKRQLSMVKTTESVQKATAAISDSFSSSGSKLVNAKASLERIKQKQQMREDKLKAAQELADSEFEGSLEDKLREAGIKKGSDQAGDILARIKAKSGN